MIIYIQNCDIEWLKKATQALQLKPKEPKIDFSRFIVAMDENVTPESFETIKDWFNMLEPYNYIMTNSSLSSSEPNHPRLKYVYNLYINSHLFRDCELILNTERVLDLLETISLPDVMKGDYFK